MEAARGEAWGVDRGVGEDENGDDEDEVRGSTVVRVPSSQLM